MIVQYGQREDDNSETPTTYNVTAKKVSGRKKRENIPEHLNESRWFES